MIFTSEMVREFRKDFEDAVRPLQEKYGMGISLGRITYGEEEFSARLTATLGTDEEERARAAFDAEAWKFEDIGIHQGMYKRIFIGRDGREYAVIGLKPRSYKQPIRTVDPDTGKRYRCGKGFIKEWTEMYYAEVLE